MRNRLSNALDAAGLTMGAAPPGTPQAQLERIGQLYLNENFGNDPRTGRPVPLQATFSDDQNTIALSAATSVPTSFATVFGIDSVTVGTRSEVKRLTQGLELAMVLD